MTRPSKSEKGKKAKEKASPAQPDFQPSPQTLSLPRDLRRQPLQSNPSILEDSFPQPLQARTCQNNLLQYDVPAVNSPTQSIQYIVESPQGNTPTRRRVDEVDDQESDVSSSTSTRTRRQQMLLSTPRKRVRKAHRVLGGQETEDQVKFRQLDRRIRWWAFLYLTKSNWAQLLRDVYGDNVDPDSQTYIDARAKVFDNIKGFKNKVLTRMEDHVQKCIEETPLLKGCTDKNELTYYFSETFNAYNFLHVWYYMNDYVDVERSSELGRFYMKSIYVNLAVATKQFIDDTDKRENLLRFYDILPQHDDYKDVEKDDFHELFDRIRNDRKKDAPWDREVLEKRYVSLGPPPSKCANTTTFAGEAGAFYTTG